jgi:hypothetical protein
MARVSTMTHGIAEKISVPVAVEVLKSVVA